MGLISEQDFAKATGLHKMGFLATPLASLCMKITRISRANAFYDRIGHLKGADFLEGALRDLGVNYHVFEQDLQRIPTKGPFILVSNHPLGVLDGLILIELISKIRPDFKLMANFLLEKVAPLQDMIITVNPFEERKAMYNNLSSLRACFQHLQDGGCLGMFPAGEVSNKNNPENTIKDKKWEISALKLIERAKVPVIPIYFHAKNSYWFYKASKISADLQTLMLPFEMFHKREKPIQLRIGKAISPKILSEYEHTEALSDFLRKRVYMLKSYYDKQKSLKNTFKKLKLFKKSSKVHEIIEPTPLENMVEDIEGLKIHDKMLFSSHNYEVYFTESEYIPSILREIGRLREITFRNIGEGTNLPLDLDEYDPSYHHLFLWDKEAQKLAGAYRMALGSQIFAKSGVKGFYVCSLFEFDAELHPFLSKSIEMGRAFVVEEYQLKAMPLFLLWRGIIHVCLRNPEHKFLLGGVSISNNFSEFSKSLMIEFMRSHYYDSVMAQYVHPSNQFKVQLKEKDKELFFADIDADLNKFDKLIDELEPSLRLPVLIKKYFKQNAKVISFNVDPNFNDAIDGLMYIKISDLPESTINPVLEELSESLNKEGDT